MQTAVIEFARNVCGLEHANTTEFDPATPDRVIYKLREFKGVDELGGTMRLGAYPCLLRPAAWPRGLRDALRSASGIGIVRVQSRL
jgi:CTP synthase